MTSYMRLIISLIHYALYALYKIVQIMVHINFLHSGERRGYFMGLNNQQSSNADVDHLNDGHDEINTNENHDNMEFK